MHRRRLTIGYIDKKLVRKEVAITLAETLKQAKRSKNCYVETLASFEI